MINGVYSDNKSQINDREHFNLQLKNEESKRNTELREAMVSRDKAPRGRIWRITTESRRKRHSNSAICIRRRLTGSSSLRSSRRGIMGICREWRKSSTASISGLIRRIRTISTA